MKILLLGDIHLGNYPKFGQPDASMLPTRLQEQKNVLDQVWDLILREQVTHVEFAGDFFHSDKAVSIECLNVAREFFKRFSENHVTFGATRGNHDLVNKTFNNPYQYSLSPFLPKFETYPVLNIYRLHYDLPTSYEDIVGYDLVIAHKMPLGSKSPASYTFEVGVDWKTLAANNKLVVFGHNHCTQKLADNCIVLGSAMQLTFGDIHKAGAWLLEDGKLTFVPINAKEFRTVTSDADVQEDGNYYRILGDSKIQSDRVIAVKEPTYFEQRLKGSTFSGILREWLELQGKDVNYFDFIRDDLDQDLYTLQNIDNLKLTRIELHNFGPFQDATLDVTNGLTLIEGKNQGFSSNGSGKSFLMDAIFYCLTGETTKGLTGDDVIRKYPKKQKDCSVSLTIKDSVSGSYTIYRSRKEGIQIRYYQEPSNVKFLNEGLKLKESQEMLDKLLGFNKLTFISSTYFNQDQLLLLTRLGTAEKNSIITTLLGFESYDKLAEILLKRVNDLENQRIAADRQVAIAEGKLISCKENLVRAKSREAALLERGKARKTALIDAQNSLAILEAQPEEVVTADTTNLEQELTSQQLLLNAATADLNALDTKLASLKISPELKDMEKQHVEARVSVSELRRNKESILEELCDLDRTTEGSVCTYCGSMVTSEHKGNYEVKKRAELAKIQAQLDSACLRVSELETKLKVLQTEVTAVERLRTEANSKFWNIQTTINSLSTQIKQAYSKQQERSKRDVSIAQQKLSIANLEAELTQLRIDYKAGLEEVIKCTGEIAETEKDSVSKVAQITTILKSIDILNFWREAVSYKGVKSLLLDGFCNDFNNILKDYMSEISNGVISAEFSPISTTKSGEARNKLDLRLTIAGLDRTYESLSGGEKRRVDIATCLAFSKWIQNRYNLPSSLLGIQIFDELFDGLDNSAEDCIAPILQREALNKAVFVVSHTRELSSYADKVVTVQKKDMVAEIL